MVHGRLNAESAERFAFFSTHLFLYYFRTGLLCRRRIPLSLTSGKNRRRHLEKSDQKRPLPMVQVCYGRMLIGQTGAKQNALTANNNTMAFMLFFETSGYDGVK